MSKTIHIALQCDNKELYDEFDMLEGNAQFYAIVEQCQASPDCHMQVFETYEDLLAADADDLPTDYEVYDITIGDQAWRRWQRDGIHMITPDDIPVEHYYGKHKERQYLARFDKQQPLY